LKSPKLSGQSKSPKPISGQRHSRDRPQERAPDRIAFVQGQGNSFDLVDTARRLREAELDVAVKEFELVRAQIAALLSQASCRV
jgi:hypothetical protein